MTIDNIKAVNSLTSFHGSLTLSIKYGEDNEVKDLLQELQTEVAKTLIKLYGIA